MSEYTGLIIWTVVVAVVFAAMWRKGYLAKIANYFALTREELKKCSWPTWSELRSSTMVVLVATIILGTFTVAADLVIGSIVRFILG
jgi:preprotein translocase subunit SecE